MLSRVTRRITRLSGARQFAFTPCFEHMVKAPPDPILGLSEAYLEDHHPDKVLLGLGAYRTNEGKPFILDCVKHAEK